MKHWLPPPPVAPETTHFYDLSGRCVGSKPSGGLTVIDHFAGVALAGMLQTKQGLAMSAEDLSRYSFDMAEAMASERARRYG